jgi:antitoxin ParD1/3/4
MADAVRAKVAAGEHATENEVIRDGLGALLARDRAVEDWLRGDVAAADDALTSDPTQTVSGPGQGRAGGCAHVDLRQGGMSHAAVFAPAADDRLEELDRDIAAQAPANPAARYTAAIVRGDERLSSFPHAACGSRTTGAERAIAFAVDGAAPQVSLIGVFYGGLGTELDNRPSASVPP